MKLLDIELREREKNAEELKMYKLILKRFGDGNFAAKARHKIQNHILTSNKNNDFLGLPQ